MSLYTRVFLFVISLTSATHSSIASTYKKQETTSLLTSTASFNTCNKSNKDINNDSLICCSNKNDKINFLVPSKSTVNPFNKNDEWTIHNLLQALDSFEDVPINILGIISGYFADEKDEDSILLVMHFRDSSFDILYKGFRLDALLKKTISYCLGCKLTKLKYSNRKYDVLDVFPTFSFDPNDGKLKESGWITKKAIEKGDQELILYSGKISDEEHACIVSDDVPKKSVIEAMHFNYAGNYVTESSKANCCSFCNLLCFTQFRLVCSFCNFLWSKDNRGRNFKSQDLNCCEENVFNFCNCIGTPMHYMRWSCCNGIYKKKSNDDLTKIEICASCFNCFSGVPEKIGWACCNGGCSSPKCICGGCHIIGTKSKKSFLCGCCNGTFARNTEVDGFGLCACKSNSILCGCCNASLAPNTSTFGCGLCAFKPNSKLDCCCSGTFAPYTETDGCGLCACRPNTSLYGCCHFTCPDLSICTCLNSSRQKSKGFLCCTWNPEEPFSSFWLCKGIKKCMSMLCCW